MQALFDFEQAPPMSVPFRFFLLAPWFIVLAGVVLMWGGAAVFASRWSPLLLATLHLLSVGFLLQVMLGALLQILPVAAGANVRAAQSLAAITQTGLVSTALLLAIGFAAGLPWAFQLAVPIVLVTMLVYVGVCGLALWHSQAQGASIVALRLALCALLPALGLGSALAAVLGWGLPWPVMTLVASHSAWALLGWALALVIAVAYLVVPMFQLTPPYRPKPAGLLPVALLCAVLLWSALLWSESPLLLRAAVACVVLMLMAGFALWTLQLQRQRRRKIADVTLWFWRLGMVAMLVTAVCGVVALFVPEEGRDRLDIAIGVLLVVGGFISLSNGMLYKIAPFLSWLHLQKHMSPAPNMKHMLPESAMRAQWYAHCAALAALLGAVFWPLLLPLAGGLLACSGAWLGRNLYYAAREFRRYRDRARLSLRPGAQS